MRTHSQQPRSQALLTQFLDLIPSKFIQFHCPLVQQPSQVTYLLSRSLLVKWAIHRHTSTSIGRAKKPWLGPKPASSPTWPHLAARLLCWCSAPTIKRIQVSLSLTLLSLAAIQSTSTLLRRIWSVLVQIAFRPTWLGPQWLTQMSITTTRTPPMEFWVWDLILICGVLSSTQTPSSQPIRSHWLHL